MIESCPHRNVDLCDQSAKSTYAYQVDDEYLISRRLCGQRTAQYLPCHHPGDADETNDRHAVQLRRGSNLNGVVQQPRG